MTPPARSGKLADQDVPLIQVVGRIAGEAQVGDDETVNTGTKYLVHVGWSKKTYQISQRGIKLVRNLDIRVLDEPSEYTV
jgi:hypothetical protein